MVGSRGLVNSIPQPLHGDLRLDQSVKEVFLIYRYIQ